MITRKLLETNPEECYRQCARYARFFSRADWEDDRGNLRSVRYVNGKTYYSFTLLNGVVIEGEWEKVV